MPLVVGVPLIVMVLLAQAAVTPDGNPVAVPMPVALAVVCVIFVNAVLIQSEGELDAAPAFFKPPSVMVQPVPVSAARAADPAAV